MLTRYTWVFISRSTYAQFTSTINITLITKTVVGRKRILEKFGKNTDATKNHATSILMGENDTWTLQSFTESSSLESYKKPLKQFGRKLRLS